MLWYALTLTAISIICLTLGISLWIKAAFLRKSTLSRYNAINDNVTDMVILWSSDFHYIEFNKAAKEKLKQGGLSADRTFLESAFGSDFNTDAATNTQLVVNALNPDGVSSSHTLLDGTTMLINWHSDMVEMSMSESVILSVGVDVTDKARIKTKLDNERRRSAISEENFTIAMQNAEIGVLSVFVDDYEYKAELSDNGRTMLGFSQTDPITLEKINEKISAVDYAGYMQQLNELLSGTRDAMNLALRMHIGQNKSHGFIIKLRSIKDEYDNVLRITGAFIDVTSQNENQNLHDRNVYYDELTGLLNRRGIIRDGEEFLDICKRGEISVALICMKVQRLQKITTLFGIEISDNLQRIYADSLTKLTEGKQALIGKIDSDDFVVLMQYESKDEIETLVRSIHIVMENACNNEQLPAVLKDQARCVAGICLYDTFDDVMTMYNKANITLYTDASTAPLSLCYFDKSIEMRVCEKELIEQEIGEAIKNTEFDLYYQPKIGFNSSRILGVEALVRWNHPKKGLLQPDEFIPAAEEIGLITKIDEWGLKKACVQNKFWQEKGFTPIMISVNMSQAQLYQTDIVASIKRALDESGLSPEYLEVELTETMAIQDIERTISILTKIKEIGVTIAMDDFGTGYSSLSSLKILPIDVIKIDKSLVYDIGDNEIARHVTKAIVELGKAMHLTVLAEGVETQEQYALLEGLGCDIAQGFFYGKPQTASDIERLYLNKE